MRGYCTYFDHRYLPRALVLYRSLKRFEPHARVWALCMDDLAFRAVTELNERDLVPISLGEFEASDPELLEVKGERSVVEYYFTCTPSLPLHVFERDSALDQVTYIDADLRFFNSPQPLFDELGENSVSIIPHRYPDDMRHMEIAGIYNVGWLTFRLDERALSVLKDWRVQCLDWCFDRFEDGKFADQKYLDYWPARFAGVTVLKNPGANLAPWNLRRHHLSMVERSISVDGNPLIFFHYHGMKRVGGPLWNLYLAEYAVRPSRLVIREIYAPYLQELAAATKRVQRSIGSVGGPRPLRSKGPRPKTGFWGRIKRPLRLLRNFIWRRYVVVVKGKLL